MFLVQTDKDFTTSSYKFYHWTYKSGTERIKNIGFYAKN